MGLIGSQMADYALAIGMDTAQGRPGDALEYTAGAGGAAYLLGPAEDSLAVIEGRIPLSPTPPISGGGNTRNIPSTGALHRRAGLF
jgi:hypothetical protein